MTTNQTIDGVLVPRELLSYWAECLESAGFKDRPAEMRALLEAPAAKNWEYFHNAMESERDYWKAQALKATQPQGEPIYQVQYLGDGGGGWSDVEKASYDAKVPHLKHWRTRIVYAEQPAPVAVVLPERLLGDDGVCTESHYASGWNACLDEVARLNPSL